MAREVQPSAPSLWYRLRHNLAVTLVLNLLAAVVVIALVQAFFVKLYVVPSGSMETTLQVGDRILVNRAAYAGGVPARGDVVVFSATADWHEPKPASSNPLKEAVKYVGDVTGIGPSHGDFLVKRVIGIPGDVVDCCSAGGLVVVNGVPQNEPYIYGNLPFSATLDCTSAARSARCFPPVTVPKGQLLVMGDHRGNSNDSVYACRGKDSADGCLKLVPLGEVIGKTFATVLPLNRIGGVH
ncbi:signal peptidase I [Arthrobacter sp. A2-55]|uniref:signal peptidase I n=1 Tax=Arthrobacter sp. A2-55 TaxID=2897337 RepID=UPI0021CD5AC8|nr:signal peptidase I [Arthrobacter sp. A2-55]MCU6481510.1 signal peptidase I [Arthrobacter sp. A2-55]